MSDVTQTLVTTSAFTPIFVVIVVVQPNRIPISTSGNLHNEEKKTYNLKINIFFIEQKRAKPKQGRNDHQASVMTSLAK